MGRRTVQVGAESSFWRLLKSDRRTTPAGNRYYMFSAECLTCGSKRVLTNNQFFNQGCIYCKASKIKKGLPIPKKPNEKQPIKEWQHELMEYITDRLVPFNGDCLAMANENGSLPKYARRQISWKGKVYNIRHFLWEMRYGARAGNIWVTCKKAACLKLEHMVAESTQWKDIDIEEDKSDTGELSMSTGKLAYLPTPASIRFIEAFNKMQMLISQKGCDENDAQKAVLFEFKFGDQSQAFMAYAGLMKTFINSIIGTYPKAEAYTEERVNQRAEELRIELENRSIEVNQELKYYMACHILDQIDKYGDQAPFFRTMFGEKGYIRNPWVQFTSILMQEVPLLFEIFSQASEHLVDDETLLVTFPRAMSFVKLIIAEKQESVNVAMKKAFNVAKLELMFK